MALIVADRIKEITTTTGTGSFSLLGQSVGYRAFSDVMATGDTCYYCAVSQSGAQWEVGLGTFNSPATLARTTIYSSSNSGSSVDFIAGTKDVFLAFTANQFNANTLPTQTGNSGKFLTTNGATLSWSDNPLGTVTQVHGTGTVNGITLTGNVTSSGNLTLGGALSGVNLGTQVTGTLSVSNGGTGANTLTGYLKGSGTSAVTASSTIPGSDISGNITGSAGNVTGTVAVTNGGTGTSNGSITGTGALTFAAGGSDQNVSINPSGSGVVLVQGITVGTGKLTSTSRHTALGLEALDSYVTSSSGYNTGIGAGALKAMTAGQHNAVVGQNALTSITVGSRHTAVGSTAGAYLTSGSNCVFIGTSAGQFQNDKTTNLATSYDSVYIGYKAYGKDNSDSNSIVIGAEAVGEGANTTVIGTSSTTYTKLNGYTKTKSILETVYTITDGSSVDINPANGGIQVWTLGANRTPTASSFAEGQSVTLMVDDGTAYAITWSSISPTWVGGSAPTLATTGYTVIELWKRSSTIYGALVGTV